MTIAIDANSKRMSKLLNCAVTVPLDLGITELKKNDPT